MSGAPPWWRSDIHEDRRPFLTARGRIQRAMRGWFEAGGFTEVDTAALQVSPGNEAHLHAFRVGDRYLHTSPEFACKKLLAAGETRIFSLGHAFRSEQAGPLHSPEFTMLEWYRAHEPYEPLMADCAALLGLAAQAAGATTLTWRGRAADPFGAPERVTVAEAFDRYAGIALAASIAPDGAVDAAALAAQAHACGVRPAADDTWSDIFSKVLAEKIEPNLGLGRPTILYEYPAHEAALARRTLSDPRLSERFELYACGVELANAFGELTDPAEQRTRLEAEMAEKQRIYGETYPLDEDFLAALAHMPQASGAALGFDRLVMLLTGATRIDQVIWTPVA